MDEAPCHRTCLNFSQLTHGSKGGGDSYRGDNSMIRPRSDGFGLPASTAISSLPLGS
jgi:hypothetical protein